MTTADIYYIVPFHLLDQPIAAGPDDILAIMVDTSPAQLAACYKALSAWKGTSSYCLSLNLSGSRMEVTGSDLVSFFFLPHYHTNNELPVILVHNGSPEVRSALMDTIAHGLEAQGFKSVNGQY